MFHSGFGPNNLKYQFSNPIRIIAICIRKLDKATNLSLQILLYENINIVLRNKLALICREGKGAA